MVRLVKHLMRYSLGIISPKLLTSVIYRMKHGEKLNWNSPQNIDEKIAWLKFNSDTSSWVELADKYKVREYVKQCGLEKLLIPIYGVWYDVDKIDFSTLPKQFVLKTNNACGTNFLVENIDKESIAEIKKTLKKWYRRRFGIESAEPHYLKIQPCVIAEQYLKESNSQSESLTDYKVWCFDGEPYMVVTYSNRSSQNVSVMPYDLNWVAHPEYRVFTKHYMQNDELIPKPSCLREMIDAASVLSKGFPEVRVDFYIVEGKLYFGEMTFTGSAGMNSFTEDILLEMGKKCNILSVKRNGRS